MTGRRLARSRLPVIVVAVAVLGVLVIPRGTAWAQPAGGAGSPPATGTNKDLGENIKTAANVGPFGNQIQAFLDDRVKALAGTDAAEQARAREDLVRQVTPGTGGAPPTRAFLTDYSTRLNAALMPLTQSTDTRVRLNAAIVAAKVSQGAGGTALLPVTRALLKDASDGVMLWALRGAQANLPASVAAGGEPLVPTIVSIGATRPRVINGVYQALAIPTTDPKLLGALVPATHAVLDARVKQYQSGLPHDPFADVRAVTYLVGQAEYQGQSVQQKQTTAQRVSDLLAVAAQRAGDLSNEQRQEVVEMIRSVGSALSVIGQREGNDPVQQIGLKLRALPRSASAKEVQDNVAPVFAALQAVPRFKGLTAPPQVGPMTAPADPATRPPPPPTTASTAPGGTR